MTPHDTELLGKTRWAPLSRTPEMFAEYRAPECPGCYGNQGHNYPCPATKTPPPRPHGLPPGFSSGSVSRASTRVWKEQSGMRSALLGTKTTGPAFIPAEHLNSRVTLYEADAIIGGGYVWHAATNYTGAGWVRPHGRI